MSLPPSSSPIPTENENAPAEAGKMVHSLLEKRPSRDTTPAERRRALLLSLLFHGSLLLAALLWLNYERPEPERFIVLELGGGTPTELLSDEPSDSVAELENPQESDATAPETSQAIASNEVETNPSQLAQPVPQPEVEVAELELTDSQQESLEQVTESSQETEAATPETAPAEASPSEASDEISDEADVAVAEDVLEDVAEDTIENIEPDLSQTETSQVTNEVESEVEASSSQPASQSTPDTVAADASNQATSSETVEIETVESESVATESIETETVAAASADDATSEAEESSQALPALESQTSIETTDSLPAPDSIAQSIPSPEIRSEVAATQAIPEPETRAEVVESQADANSQAEAETAEDSESVAEVDDIAETSDESIDEPIEDSTTETVATDEAELAESDSEDAANQEALAEANQDDSQENNDAVAETSDATDASADITPEEETSEDNQELSEPEEMIAEDATEDIIEDVEAVALSIPSSGASVVVQAAQSIAQPDTRSYVQPARAIPSSSMQAVVEAGRAIPSPAVQASVSAARSIPSPQARSELRISSSAPSIEAVLTTPAQGEAGQAGVGALAEQAGAPARAFEGILKRPVAVMLDNTNNGYPQTGLQQANLIIEAPVSTDITRLMAVYKQDDAAQVGPVRSTREFFVRLMRNADGILVHAGGSVEALSSIAENRQRTLNSLSRADIFARVPRGAVPYEYTLYSNGAAIREVLRNENLEQTQRVSVSAYVPPAESPSETSVSVSIYSYRSGFQYDASNNQYRWQRRGSPASDTSGAVWVDAVVVANLAGASVLDGGTKLERLSITSNSGSATLYLNGRTVSGSWRTAGGFTFLDSQGAALDLTPLKTWVIFVPPWGEVN